MQRLALVACMLLSVAAVAPRTASAQSDTPIKIALIEDKTGPLEAYAKQSVTGFRLGLEYATHGTNMVAGRKIEILEKDSQTKPELGRSLLGEAFGDDDADLAVGGTSSAVALAMLPVAEEYKKLLIVEPAVADSITGAKWNRYIFRTARNSTQDAIANALAVGKPGVVIATLAQDYAFGRDGVAAFREALESTGAKLVAEEYAPPATTDFTAPAQRLFDALANQTGRKMIFVLVGRCRSDAEAQGARPGAAWHRTGDRRQYSAGAEGLEGFFRHGRGAVLLLRHSEKPDERLAGRRAPEAVRPAAGFLHRRRDGCGSGGGGCAGKDQGRHRHRNADQGDGGHDVRHARRGR